jgi:hypothetical protein
VICSYIDESGNSGTDLQDPNQPRHYVGALLTKESSWKAIRSDLVTIAEKAIAAGAKADGFEFHGRDMYQGLGCWDQVSRPVRMQIFEQSIKVLHAHNAHIAYGCADKVKLRKYAQPMHPQRVAFWLCLERIARYASAENCLAMIVADDTSPSMRSVTTDTLNNYRNTGPPFGPTVDLSCVIDKVHYMVSHESLHLQLIDMCLYAIQRWHSKRSPGIKTAFDLTVARVYDCRTFPY